MFDLSILKLSGAMTRHAVARQTLVSENIAHADTPGYLARDIQDFSEVVANKVQPFAPKATKAAHFGTHMGAEYRPMEISAFGSEQPNGNTVTLEDQMVRSAGAKFQHDLALTIYSTSLGILRTSLGRRG